LVRAVDCAAPARLRSPARCWLFVGAAIPDFWAAFGLIVVLLAMIGLES
jgi:hypothetical protein